MDALVKVRRKIKQGLMLRYALDRISDCGLRIDLFQFVEEGITDGSMAPILFSQKEYLVRLLEPEEIDEVTGHPEVSLTRNYLLAKLKDGSHCLGLFIEGSVAAYSWYNSKECTFEAFRFPLKEKEAYLFSAHTFKAYRGMNLAPFLRYRLYKHLYEKGFVRLYSVTDRFNSPAIRFKRKLNARPLKLFFCVEVFKKYRWITVLKEY